MTSKQRMLTAMGNGIPDMVPVAPDISNMIPCKLTGKPFWDIYLYDDPPLWRAYINAVHYFGFDGWLPNVPIEYVCEADDRVQTWCEAIVRRSNERIITRYYRESENGIVWSDLATIYFIDSPPYRHATLEQAGLSREDPDRWEPVEKRTSYSGYEAYHEAYAAMGEAGVIGLQVRPDPDGGVTHGVGYMDTLEWLHRITRDNYFADAAVWLYRDYSDHAPDTFKDLSIPYMRDPEVPWHDHGAHVGEAIHMPAIAAWFSGNQEIAEAADNVLGKLKRHTNPAGGLTIGYLEAIAAAHGGGHVLNENCAHIEAMMSLNRLHAFRPSAEIGDWRERCIFNVVQGARMHPVDTAVSYLSRDNRLHASDPEIHGGRELFSPCHEAAACCVLNVPRAMPYYLEGMWYRLTDRPGLHCAAYGPSVLVTELDGIGLRLEQQTNYPFSDLVTFVLELERPARFELVFRIPEGSSGVDLDVPRGIQVVRKDRSIQFGGEWRTGDRIDLNFNFIVERHVQADGQEAYWRWGSLVFALPFPDAREIRTEVSSGPGVHSGFNEYLIRPASTTGWTYLAGVDTSFKLVEIPGDWLHPWVKPPIALEGTLYDRSWNPVDVRLLPMGASILRRTTFPFHFLVPPDPGTNNQLGVTADDDPMRAF